MKISCIIPVFNDVHLNILLKSIKSNLRKPDEVIIVDDASDELEITCESYKVLKNTRNMGVSFSRNRGAEIATGDIIVFLDSDVEIKKDFFHHIELFFSENTDVHILGGGYSSYTSSKNIFTRYKAAYMKFIHAKAPYFSNFVLGGCVAVKKCDYVEWNPRVRYAEDTFWGHENVYIYNRTIVFNKNLEVDHHKEYNFISWVGNDFRIAAGMVNSYLYFLSKRRDRKFSHVSYFQIIALLISPMVLLSLLMCKMSLMLSFILMWLFFSFRMIVKISNQSKINVFLVILISFLNSLIHFAGIVYGTIMFFLK